MDFATAGHSPATFVAVVLFAGAVPGLPVVAADFLLRGFEWIERLEIATTGPWTQSARAREDLERSRPNPLREYRDRSWRRPRRAPT